MTAEVMSLWQASNRQTTQSVTSDKHLLRLQGFVPVASVMLVVKQMLGTKLRSRSRYAEQQTHLPMVHLLEVEDVAEDEHGCEGGPQQNQEAGVGCQLASKSHSLIIEIGVEQRVQVAIQHPDGRQHQRHQPRLQERAHTEGQDIIYLCTAGMYHWQWQKVSN